MDYIGGIVLIGTPWALGLPIGGPETWIPVTIGVLMLGAAMFTDYEFGLVRMIPMPMHLGMDAMLGVVLAISPWMFHFEQIVWIPHLVVGVAEIGGALMTQTRASRRGPLSALGI